MPPLSLARLETVNLEHVQAAGARYTPALDANAPNLEITSLLDAIEALGLTNRHNDTLSSLVGELSKAWGKSPPWIRKLFARCKQSPAYLIELLTQLPTKPAGEAANVLANIRRTSSFANERLRREEDTIWNYQISQERESDKYKQAQHKLRELREITAPVASIYRYTASKNFALINNPRMFIRGQWGTGKTHFLCDITLQRQKLRQPTLFLLAHRLIGREDLLLSICDSTGLARGPKDLLKKLNELGKRSGGRALIIIDGINEADRDLWKQGIGSLAQQADKYPNVGLVLSCRSPFERQILDKATEKLFVQTVHTGFEEIEFDAQGAFFDFYKIPHPHIPMLVPEFTRPLFLHTLCKSLAGKTRSGKSRAINAISSGQKGMTKVLEDFVRVIGAEIEDDFQLPHLTCWRILKGGFPPQGSKETGIAVTMAETACDVVDRTACTEILQAWTGFDDARVEALLQRMLTDGLLAEDVSWISGDMEEVIRLPFQRFSDHLICRHLLGTYLKTETEQEIRQSFHKNRPLGKIFDVDEWGQTYSQPNLATALMLEFPERVRRTLPEEERELVFYLPKRVRLATPLQDVFLDGLLWRSSGSFTKQTDSLVSFYLQHSNQYVQQQVLEALVCLASRPNHPYSANRLAHHLASKTAVERDLYWSEFLRMAEPSSVVHRLLDWIEGQGKSALKESAAENVIRLCSLYLTTTDRALRDRATKCLVLLGERHPSILFKRTIETLGFDDPYIPERMLAASYGVLMRQWVGADKKLSDTTSEFARGVYDAMFEQSAPAATSYILMRDYAIGIIQLARKLDPRCLGRRTIARLKPPYPASKHPIPAARNIPKARCEGAKPAILMDFENYTIGSLVKGRGNYDYGNKEYQGVVRQIKWRILNLGYTEEAFKTIDRLIGQASFNEGRHPAGAKVDRYGKKYSWIAFFEVSGIRAEAGVLPYFGEEKRISYTDIDPSFPEPARKWQPPLRTYFRKPLTNVNRWIHSGPTPKYNHLLQMDEVDGLHGPWTLLDGFIQENHQSDHREVFTFLRGVLAAPKDISDLGAKFLAREYPGNHAISDGGSDDNAYAGEISWRDTVGLYLRSPSGKLVPHIEEILDEHIHRRVRKSVASLTDDERVIATLQQARISLFEEGDGSPNRLAELNPDTIIEIDQYDRNPGVRVEIPVHTYEWGSGRSAQNQHAYFQYPALTICDRLGLKVTGDMNELVDTKGRTASIFCQFGPEASFERSRLLYLRTDLLSKYQKSTNQQLVWMLWGERSLHYSRLQNISTDLQHIFSTHRHIHRTFAT